MGNHEFAKSIGAKLEDTIGIKLRAEIQFLRPAQIVPDPDQPREDFDKAGLARLADSLRRFGQLQPVLVRKEGAQYMLVAGERRWRAAQIAGIPTIQALVCRGGDVRSLQLIENILREDLKPIEQAKAFQAIMKREKWSARELARQLHLEHSGVTRALRLLDLPENVQADVEGGRIPPTTAYEIAKRPKAEHKRLARDAASGKLKGEDLRQKPATPAPAKPALLLGTPPSPSDWRHPHGKGQVVAIGYPDRKSLVAALKSALARAESSPQPLLGGLGH